MGVADRPQADHLPQRHRHDRHGRAPSTVHFLGLISPPILLLAIPALVARRGRRLAAACDAIGGVALAWFAGTWLPFAALSLFWLRTSYLYYMVIVMPGIYLAVARLLTRPRMLARWALPACSWLLVLAAAVLTYPFLPLPRRTF